MAVRFIWNFVVLAGTTMLTTGVVTSSSLGRVAAFTLQRQGPAPVRSAVFQHQTAIHLRGFSLLASQDRSTHGQDLSGAQHSSSSSSSRHPQPHPTDYYRSRPSPARRRFSSGKDNDNNNDWHVPDHVPIPEKQLEFSFVRSSGAGGQNVNKVNTCVQVRFHVESALWMPSEVRQRFQQKFRNNINREGYYVTESQAERTQTANRRIVLAKLQRNVLEAWPRPYVRKVREGISEKGKEIRRKEKEMVKKKKEGRKSVINFD